MMAARPPRSRTSRPRREAAPTPTQARNRLRSGLSRIRLSRGHLVTALVTALLGIALVAQVRVTEEAGLHQLRETELVALLDDVSTRADELREEVRGLEADRARLQGGAGDVEAAAAAQERLQSYQILAGTVPVEGPGITVRVVDAGAAITQTMLLDGIQELRDAGAEAIQIGTVRVVASTWVGTDEQGRVSVAGVPLEAPFSITAIGDPHTLAGAMAIPGGFSDSLRGAGATVTVVEAAVVSIESLHESSDARYARPVPASPTS